MSRASYVALLVAAVSACALVVPAPPVTEEPRQPQPEPPCIRRRPPEPPQVDWLAAGCPTRYGGCLSGSDAAALASYLAASRRWMAETARRCDGR